jgi:hypothetical protein
VYKATRAKLFIAQKYSQQKTALRRFNVSHPEWKITGTIDSKQQSHLGSQQRYQTMTLCLLTRYNHNES